MSSDLKLGAVVLAGLLAAGGLLHLLLPAERGAWGADTTEEGTAPEARRGLAGAGLGGFGGLAADFAWIAGQGHWEERDGTATEAMVRLATTLDPGRLYFWLNGARMIAYDVPVWRMESVTTPGGEGDIARSRERIFFEQGRRAVRLLDRALARYPDHGELWIERAAIRLHVMKDVAGAAEDYRRAAILPGAPFYAARLHAEMLVRLERRMEAYHWLCGIYPSLPPDDEAAAAGFVLSRIRRLEQELKIKPPFQ